MLRAQINDRDREQQLRQRLCFKAKRTKNTESVDKTPGGDDQADEESIPGCTSGAPEEGVGVHAEVIMPYLRILLVRANHNG
jgi:hypothetical protein